MVKEEPELGWRVIGNTVKGASHIRAELPNQDAIGWWPEDGQGLPVILAVSDGHGSPKYFRSHRGAQLAVETALKILKEFLCGQAEETGTVAEATAEEVAPADNQLDLSNISFISQMAEERLPKNLTRTWLEAVEKDIEEKPFSEDELIRLEKLDQEVAETVRAKGAVTPLAYGATLLAVLVTESFILYLQIGDGDILTVSETEEVARPIAEDERLMANETTSLCSKDAWADFRVKVQPTIDSKPPALILVSTDGYANSFRDEKSFLQIGPDLLDLTRNRGLDSIKRMMESWLNEASQVGSGDDITLGIIRHLSQRDQDQMLRQTSEAHSRIDAGEIRLQTHEQEIKDCKSELEQIHQKIEPLEGVLLQLKALAEGVYALQNREQEFKSIGQLSSRLKWELLAGLLLIVLALGADLLFHLRSPTINNPSSPSSVRESKPATGASESSNSSESAQTANRSSAEPERAESHDESAPIKSKTKDGSSPVAPHRKTAKQTKERNRR